MSADWTTVFPTDPFWVPSRDRADAAAAVFGCLVDGESDVEVRTVKQLLFESAGADFGTASCPMCAAVVAQNPEDMGWFTGQLDRVFAELESSRTLQATMPCCGVSVSMNDVLYDPPAGFACWSVSVRGARYAVGDRERALVEAALGHDVRVVELRV
ncbi:MAG: hypothetical protein ACSLFA_26610 [Mycobacterium sp.]